MNTANVHHGPRPLSWRTKAVLFFAGVLLPPICFLVAALMSPAGTWQSGNLNDILCYLLAPPAVLPFAPLVLLMLVSFNAALINEDYARRFVVRGGIYSGVVLSLQYVFLLAIMIGDIPDVGFTMLVMVPCACGVAMLAGFVAWLFVEYASPLVVTGLEKIASNIWQSRALSLQWGAFALVTIALCTALGIGIYAIEFVGGTIGIAVIVTLVCAPSWALATYCTMAVRVYRAQRDATRFTLIQLLGVMTWLCAYLAAWRWGVRLSLEQYAKLPVTPPADCYVCSAAMCGHAAWVKADCVTVSGGGASFRVNDQMRYLKAAEWLIKEKLPRVHRAIRLVYDRLGPRLAATLTNRFAADLAYVALKPAEWLGRIALLILVPDSARLVRALYGTETKS